MLSLLEEATKPPGASLYRMDTVREMRNLRGDLEEYLIERLHTGDPAHVRMVTELVAELPGLDLFDITTTPWRMPDAPSEKPEAEPLLKLYLALLTAQCPSDPQCANEAAAAALELIAGWTSAPRPVVAWTELVGVDNVPWFGVIEVRGDPADYKWIYRDELAKLLPSRRDQLEAARQQLEGWYRQIEGGVIWGRFSFDENTGLALKDKRVTDVFPHKPWMGLCARDEYIQGSVGGRRMLVPRSKER